VKPQLAVARVSQVAPSELVITRLLPPSIETATNKLLPNVTDCQELFTIAVRGVQVSPFVVLVITLSVPPELTATNTPLPYVTDSQELGAAEGRLVQVIPSGLVITRLLASAVLLTATKTPLP